MWFITQVSKWVDRRDSKLRVDAFYTSKYGFHWYLLNPNRISDLKDLSTLAVAKSSFLFSDNHRDRRENNSYLEAFISPAAIRTAHDTAFHSQFVTLPICPKNDPRKTPVDTIIDVGDLAFAWEYHAPPELDDEIDQYDFIWVCYNKKAFKRVEVLCKLSLDNLEDIGETGTTSAYTTTYEGRG